MTLAIAIGLIVLWILLRVVFKVAKWSIHLVLLVAAVAMAMHFLRSA